MNAAEWQSEDVGAAVDVLNANASSFGSSVNFVGWFPGNGAAFSPIVVDFLTDITAYGVVSIGDFTPHRAYNRNHRNVPTRQARFLIELFLSKNNIAIRRIIYASALEALADMAGNYEIFGDEWRSPASVTLPDESISYYSTMASVPYLAA